MKRLILIAFLVLCAPASATVYTFGSDLHGELCLGHKGGHNKAPQAVKLGGVKEVQLGYFVTYLRTASSLYSCGGNDLGQLGTGTARNQVSPLPQPIPLAGVKEVAQSGGGSHTLALLSDGSVWQWGIKIEGNNSLGSVLPVPVGITATAIAHGGGESYALLANGTVDGWKTYEAPQPIPGLHNVKAIAAGGTFPESTLYALQKDGSVKARGSGKYGQTQTSTLRGIVQLAAGGNWAAARDSSGNLLTWGEDFGNALGYSATETCGKRKTPCSRVPHVILSGVSDVAAGTNFGLAISAHKPYEWGRVGHLGALPITALKLKGIVGVAADESHGALYS